MARKTKQSSRQEIIQAAVRCLLRDGYQSTSMDDIVRESGLSKGTLYWHFQNKKALFLEVFTYLLDQMMADMVPLLKKEFPPDQKIQILLDSLKQVEGEASDLMTLPLNLMTDLFHDQDFLNHYREVISDLAQQTQQIIEDGIDQGLFRSVNPEETAWSIMAIYDGVLLYKIMGMPLNLEQQSRLLGELMIRGLQAQASQPNYSQEEQGDQ